MSDCPDEQNCNKFAYYLLENYVTFDSKLTTDMWAGIPSEEKRTNNQNHFTLTLTNSSAHLIQPFSYLTSYIYVLRLSTTFNYP